MTTKMLMVETAEGDMVAVRFASREEAETWEAAHEEIEGRGFVSVVSKAEALRLSRPAYPTHDPIREAHNRAVSRQAAYTPPGF